MGTQGPGSSVATQGPGSSVETQGPGSSVWCVKSCARALAALKKFSTKRQFTASHKCVMTRYEKAKGLYLSSLTTKRSRMVSHREVTESEAVMMSVTLHRWANGVQKR